MRKINENRERCLMRAFITAFGLGANRPQDAVYPMSTKDSDDTAYDGNGKLISMRAS
jgi:hypothetical protein